MAQILIVEDEESISTLIQMNLELVGHECVCVFDGNAAIDALETNKFDLILLDVMLPEKDGFQIIEEMKQKIPVIFLTARGALSDRVKGLNLGADDYLVKPFEMLELQARIESVLRRTKKEKVNFKLGDVEVDFTAREVWFKGERVEFTYQEFALVEILINNRNIAMSRELLLERAWGFDYTGETRTVDAHIHTIRKKLGWEKIIKTIYKLGYRLEVKE